MAPAVEAERLQSYLRRTAASGRRRIEVAGFDAFIHPRTDNRHLNFAMPRPGEKRDPPALIRAFEAEGRVPRVEWIEQAAPDLEEPQPGPSGGRWPAWPSRRSLLNRFQRRGIGARLTAELAGHAFAPGDVDLAFLTPGSEATGRVYARAGFAAALTARFWNRA